MIPAFSRRGGGVIISRPGWSASQDCFAQDLNVVPSARPWVCTQPLQFYLQEVWHPLLASMMHLHAQIHAHVQLCSLASLRLEPEILLTPQLQTCSSTPRRAGFNNAKTLDAYGQNNFDTYLIHMETKNGLYNLKIEHPGENKNL